MPRRGIPTKPERGRDLCPRTGKRRYRSEGQAERAADEFAARYAAAYDVYRCRHCRGYHLSTQTQRRLAAWTGPRDEDWGDAALGVLREQVPGERWPHGPPDVHEGSCRLRSGGLFCDCAASEAGDLDWGTGA